MKKLILLLILMPAIAIAETVLPNGCYVAYSNPNYCFSPTAGTLTWVAGGTAQQQFLGEKYGTVVAAIIVNGWLYKQNAESCNASFDVLVNDYNGLVNQYNQCLSAVQNQTTCPAPPPDQSALVAKLKKKIKRLKKKLRRR